MVVSSALVAALNGLAGPSSAEFTRALQDFTGKPVSVADVRNLSCERVHDEPTEAACKWQQRRGHKWTSFSTYIAVDRRGWHLIDEPYPAR